MTGHPSRTGDLALTRRLFLATTGAASVATGLGASAWADEAVSRLVVVDSGLAGADRFARLVGAAQPLDLSRMGVTAAWGDVLDPALAAGTGIVAGYTSAASLFGLTLMARDRHARLVHASPDVQSCRDVLAGARMPDTAEQGARGAAPLAWIIAPDAIVRKLNAAA